MLVQNCGINVWTSHVCFLLCVCVLVCVSFPSWYCSKAVYKPVYLYDVPSWSVQGRNFGGGTAELSETCRVSWQNKFVKLVHLVGFITKKFFMTHGHMNVKPRSVSVVLLDCLWAPLREEQFSPKCHGCYWQCIYSSLSFVPLYIYNPLLILLGIERTAQMRMLCWKSNRGFRKL